MTGALTLVLAHGTRPDQSPWRWDPHLDVAAVMLVLIGLYLLALKAAGGRVVGPGEPLLSRRQRWLLSTAAALLWSFSAWPVHNLAEGFSYTVHMVQHSVYTLVVPPLLILGTPAWLWRRALQPVMPAARRLFRPWVAVAVYSAVTTATHLPVLADSAVRNGFSHFAQHVALVVSAVAVWWPLTGPLPELRRVRAPRIQVVYLFFLSLAPSIAGSFLIWASSPLYRAYEPFPHLFGLSTLDDQQTGGVVMELVEGLVIWGLILLVLLRTARREGRSAEGEDRGAQDEALVDHMR